MPVIKNISQSWIIHIFALLHAAVALICRIAGVGDELLLTVLTMAMSLLICYKKQVSIEFTAAVIIVGNIIGYLMGTLGASIFELIFQSPYVVHALSTAVTTEVLGWSIVAITKIFRQSNSEGQTLSTSYIRWILLAAGGIFVIRILIVLFFSREAFETDYILDMTGKVLSNTVGLIILVCLNILYVRFARQIHERAPIWGNALIFIGFMVIASLIEALIVGLGIPFNIKQGGSENLGILLTISILAQITVYCIVYIINYALTSRDEMNRQREAANMAQYRYLKLKRQVNPHFLFNSLNILDCLVCEEKTEQASTYIHKLAGIYRYMLKSEDEDLVQLHEELVFVGLYVDLLKVRFPEGFEVEIDVPEDMMAMFVLPCSLQLLIENATKHNAVSSDNPLTIRIEAEGNRITVSNNIIPKVTTSPSTGLGQKYIRQQYLDLSGKEIDIRKTEDTYCVTLPLL